jgi:hypothetical protein
MEAYIRILKGTVLLLWAILYSIVEPFIPKRLLHKNVKNQIVLITGAGSGFGRLLAKKFAIDHGSVVVLWDINKSGECSWYELVAYSHVGCLLMQSQFLSHTS